MEFRLAIESWFNASMERVSTWYKKRTRIVMLGYGVLVAIAFNVSAVNVTTELYENDVVRNTVVALAETETGSAIEDCTTWTCVEDEVSAVLDTGLPIWWRTCPGSTADSDTALCGFEDFWSGVVTVTGWLITAAALSIGASFWFAFLKRVFRLRSDVRGASS